LFTTIADCGALTSLRALASLTTVDGTVSTSTSGKLPTCEAEWLERRLEALGELVFYSETDDDAPCP
jgi:hypothetical protein